MRGPEIFFIAYLQARPGGAKKGLKNQANLGR